jgi:hypothetical protein
MLARPVFFPCSKWVTLILYKAQFLQISYARIGRLRHCFNIIATKIILENWIFLNYLVVRIAFIANMAVFFRNIFSLFRRAIEPELQLAPKAQEEPASNC